MQNIGWKSILGAVALIATGVSMIVNGHYAEGVQSIAAGLAVFGIRMGIAKAISAASK